MSHQESAHLKTNSLGVHHIRHQISIHEPGDLLGALHDTVEIVDELAHEPVLRTVVAERCVKQFAAAEERRHVVDTLERLWRQVPANDALQQVTALRDRRHEVRAVVGGVTAVVPDNGKRDRLHLAHQVFSKRPLLLVKAPVVEEDARLDGNFDCVLDHLLGALLVGVVLRDAVGIVEEVCARVVDERVYDLARRHLAEEFLLRTHADALRVKVLGHCNPKLNI